MLRDAAGQGQSFTSSRSVAAAINTDSVPQPKTQLQVTNGRILAHIGLFGGPRRIDTLHARPRPYNDGDGITLSYPRNGIIAFLRRMRSLSTAVPPPSNDWTTYWRQSSEWATFVDAFANGVCDWLMQRGSAEAWGEVNGRWWRE